jgi:hypothetical protein
MPCSTSSARHWKTIATLISGPFAPIVFLATDAFGVRSALVGAFRAITGFIGDRIDDVVGFFRALPGRIGAFIEGQFRQTMEAWKAIFVAVKNFVGDQVDAVVGFFEKLPGRLLGLVGSIKSAAASIGKGIFDAIVGALKDFGSVVAGILKAPINAVIDAINAIKIPGVSIRIRVLFSKDINFRSATTRGRSRAPHSAGRLWTSCSSGALARSTLPRRCHRRRGVLPSKTEPPRMQGFR